MKTEDSYTQNKSLLKAIAILDSFSPNEPELSAAGVSLKSNIGKMTTHRILSTLTQSGFLEKDMVSGKYRIGPAIYMMSSLYLKTTNIPKAAEPVMQAMNALTGEVIVVNILDGRGNVMVLMREERKIGFRWSTHSTIPAYASAGGKLLLSNLSDRELDDIYPEEKLKKVAAKTISTKTQLKQQLKDIKKTDLAFTREEYLDGIESVASLIRNSKNEAVAALAIAMPLFGASKIKKLHLDKLVQLGASLISYRLGYAGGDLVVKDVNKMIDLWKQREQRPTTKITPRLRNKRRQ